MSEDGEALHAVGNGRVLGYLHGADLVTMFGPNYSSPDLGALRWNHQAAWTERHTPGALPVFAGDGIAELTVFAEAAAPAITWTWTSAGDAGVVVSPRDGATSWHAIDGLDGAWVCEIPRGELVFVYPSVEAHYLIVLAHNTEAGPPGRELVLRPGTGPGWASLVAGIDFAVALDDARALAAIEPGRRTADAATLLASRTIAVTVPPCGQGRTPFAESLWQDAADQILAQQSAGGGIVAGHHYALCYLRDQFGTCEGLLTLGLFDAVRANIDFRFGTWSRYGNLANAECMSGEAIRHFHENDHTELTGYMVLQVLRYTAAAGETDTLRRVAPMLEWCLVKQSEQLAGGAMPFNGDETYVAGGILPRWALDDGSLEATVLFHEAIRGLRPYRALTEYAHLDWSRLDRDEQEIEHRFAGNFVRGHGLVTNSLRRRREVRPAPSRHGVCENCLHFPTGLIRNPSGRFVCYRCTAVEMPAPPELELSIVSSTLFGGLVESPLLIGGADSGVVEDAARRWAVAGHLSADPDSTRSVGYDEGLLLRRLLSRGHPAADSVAAALAARRDRYGMWAEYYDDEAPVGTRCRPWESGLNIAALARYQSDLPNPPDGR